MEYPISRLYDFVAGTRIKSAEVDAEFNQLVLSINYLITEVLQSTGEGKGANFIAADNIDGVSSSGTLQSMLIGLKALIDGIVIGNVPAATPNTIGAIIVGSCLQITPEGLLSARLPVVSSSSNHIAELNKITVITDGNIQVTLPSTFVEGDQVIIFPPINSNTSLTILTASGDMIVTPGGVVTTGYIKQSYNGSNPGFIKLVAITSNSVWRVENYIGVFDIKLTSGSSITYFGDKLIEKASVTEADIGTDDNKYITPKSLKESKVMSTLKTAEIYGLAQKSTPVDNDVMLLEDSTTIPAFLKKRFTFNNLKEFLKTYFDNIYSNSTDINSALNGKQKTISYGTSEPTGGVDGDIYIQYE